ncbi:MAG: hypothetical protein AAF989_06565, partial [Planctomycetota bacterium]
MNRLAWLLLSGAVFWGLGSNAVSGQGTVKKTKYKLLPPPGIELDADVKDRLTARVDALQRAIEAADVQDRDWRPHVEVFTTAVRRAIDQRLFYKPDHASKADALLDEADRRLRMALAGKRGLELIGFDVSKNDQPQPVAGGFRSRIDDSIQPFGLVLPVGYEVDGEPTTVTRLDVWLHGRGDTKAEGPFLLERMSKQGEYAPEGVVMLHPFGRHCNAFKFAGETDVMEAIDAAQRILGLSDDQSNLVSVRGFSMGGAGCWHLGVHHPGQWFGVNPGAGFVDTLVYQGWNESPPFPLDPVQRKLLNWYDVLPYVGNLKNTRVVAYSGEVDKQKQAADRVMAASKQRGFDWPYVIGEGMGHKINAPS